MKKEEVMIDQPLVEVKNLKKYFPIKGKGILHAVDDVSFTIMPGETMALVGESGCGKSTIGNMVMRLLKPTEGRLYYQKTDVLQAKGEKAMELRKSMQMIFQDPFSSLNPRKTIYRILAEAYEIHHEGTSQEIRKKVE